MEHDPKKVFRHLMAVMIVGTILVGGMYYSAFVASAGEKEFQRAHDAVHQATSWRMREGSSGAVARSEMTAEVICPDNLHVSKSVEYTQETANNYSYEDALVNGIWYHMDGKTRVWRLAPGYESDFIYLCRLLGRDDDAPPLPPFKQLIRSTSISKGKQKSVNGVTCRVWHARFPIKDMAEWNEEICIDAEHLPRERRVGGNVYTYWDWNKPFTVKRPLVFAAGE